MDGRLTKENWKSESTPPNLHIRNVLRVASLPYAAVKGSSAASDPAAEGLVCTLDHRSLLGMLKHIFAHREEPSALRLASPMNHGPPSRTASAAAAAADPKLLKQRLGREAFMLGYKV